MAIQIENGYAKLQFGDRGEAVAFIEKSTGANYIEAGAPIARLRKAGREYPAMHAAATEGRIALEFGDCGVSAQLRITPKPHYFIVEVLSISDPAVEEFAFIDLPLRLKGAADEPFAGCALALNLQTNVLELPQANARLRAIAYPRFGFAGARVAIIGCPQPELRRVMQEAVSDAPDLPHSPLGGPWALDSRAARGSYLFNFGDVTEETVDDWIRLVKAIGFNQLDFHGGGSFRFGDCQFNPKMYPRGRASMRAVIDRLHDAGILAGLHMYAFFIDKACPWVAPVPDRRLARKAAFTLAEPLSLDATEVRVTESTEGVSNITGFFVRNSVALRIDDELILFSDGAKKPPYGFAGCQRGALGTKAAPHARGEQVDHLNECFGLFAPDGDSSLYGEVAGKVAEAYNECGFDMMYLDALDGEDVPGGPQHAWHYGSKFVFELWKRIRKPALMEMSTFHHHLWYVRSRLGAWDHPNRSHKRFIDLHAAANEGCRRMLLPDHLGWWAVKTWNGVQGEPTFSDDIEYLCGKCLATDTGLALMGIDPTSLKSSPVLNRLADMIKRYETLRHSDEVPATIRAKLAERGAEVRLSGGAGTPAQFRPAQYLKHKITALDGRSNVWRVSNEFGRQPLKLRIEALMSVTPYDAAENVTLAEWSDRSDRSDTSDLSEFFIRERSEGIEASLQISRDPVKAGTASGQLTARRTQGSKDGSLTGPSFSPSEHGVRSHRGPVPGWSKIEKVFSPTLDLGERQALGLWVHGDGRGELLNVQTRSPEHISGGIGDHHITVDFTGWRYFELVETEAERVDDYVWPYSHQIYSIYREGVEYSRFGSLSLWFNNLPADGQVCCFLSPIRALKLVKAKLVNPAVTVNGRTVTFPVEIESGSYLEFLSRGDCTLYDQQGAVIRKVSPCGDVPDLVAGESELTFTCEPPKGVNARARVTVMTEGEPLR